MNWQISWHFSHLYCCCRYLCSSTTTAAAGVCFVIFYLTARVYSFRQKFGFHFPHNVRKQKLDFHHSTAFYTRHLFSLQTFSLFGIKKALLFACLCCSLFRFVKFFEQGSNVKFSGIPTQDRNDEKETNTST